MTEQGDVVERNHSEDEEEVEKESPKEGEKARGTAARKKVTPSVTRKLQKKLKEQKEIMEKVIEERDEFKDKYLRSLAEMDNFRKRVKKEKEEFQKYVLGDFIFGLLEVVDNLERALKAKTPSEKKGSVVNLLGSDDEKSIISGVEMIYKQLLDLIKKNNVLEIDALGKAFDPNLHQALSKEEREDVSEPIVLEVYQKGYMYNEKLLRPTLAKVAIPKEEVEEVAEETNEEESSGEE
jgi:molecular chaperone GrpE